MEEHLWKKSSRNDRVPQNQHQQCVLGKFISQALSWCLNYNEFQYLAAVFMVGKNWNIRIETHTQTSDEHGGCLRWVEALRQVLLLLNAVSSLGFDSYPSYPTERQE